MVIRESSKPEFFWMNSNFGFPFKIKLTKLRVLVKCFLLTEKQE